MSNVTLSVDLVTDIPNQSFTAKLGSVRNSVGADLTELFVQFCQKENLSLTTSAEIESASLKFIEAYRDNSAVLP
jgi:hypothetical protein